jgi:hypothetical protein
MNYSGSRLGAVQSDLTSIPLSYKATVYTQVGKTSPSLLATLKSFPLLIKERDVRNGQGEVFQDFG